MASLVSASVPASATGGAPGCIDFERVDRGGQDLVLDLDQVEGLLGDGQLVGGHGGDRLADEHDAIDGQHGVGPRRGLALQLGDVGRGEDRAHAGQRLAPCWCRCARCGRGRGGSGGAWRGAGPRALRSATYWTCPVTFSGPSGRGMASPTPLTSRVVFITVAMAHAPLRRARAPRGLGDRRQHLGVARAPAEIAGDAVADLLLRRARILGEQGRRGHEDARDAEAALRHAVPDEGVLERMQRAGPAEPLDGPHRAAAHLHGQHQAARDGLPSRWTVQAPQSPVPQPSLGPVRPRSRAGCRAACRTAGRAPRRPRR